MIIYELKDDCVSCNVVNKKNNNERCNNCIFVIYANDRPVINKNIRRKYNLPLLTKSYFYYLLYHPELNWKLPNLPMRDYLGNYSYDKKNWFWVIHHEDLNHFNDSKWNLILMLNTEHSYLHMTNLGDNHPMKNPEIIEKVRNTHKLKVKNKTHHLITNYPFKDNPELTNKRAKTCSETMKRQVELGIHHIVTNNPNYSSIKLLNLEKYINELPVGIHILDEQLVKFLGYNEQWSLRHAIIRVLDRKKLLNKYYLFNNSKDNRWRKWYLERREI